ncbi:M3 family metallopeptidase [uncultured Aquimonas sp.]|uniref:M3 family metallopeptidase n=1 Tax=uncultured Aquimonas sp. TaxID=385483 RepID=UPI00086BE683|nr:M3 family metallopeptidase [uncultured Aquimonas sp.]ODU48119.1 MAG: dipeptidyl carboxypeptidase II [Xanthomonadaceae bacterium SCN 69-123]
MRSPLLTGALAGAITLALGLTACSKPEGEAPAPTASAPAEAAPAAAADLADNPFMSPSTLPLMAPDFTKIRDEHYLPALLEGMKQHAAEVEAIANNPEPPTVENTLVALERSGALLMRTARVFGNLAGTDTNPTIQKVQAEFSPKMAAHQDSILLNPKLFERVKSIYDAREVLNLDAETKRLVEQTHLRMVRAGAELSEDAKTRIRALNEEQAGLMTAFQQALLKQTELASVVVDDVAQLDGLSEGQIAAAAEAAKASGHEGKWLIRITNTTRQPVLTSLKNRELRQRVWEASANRGLVDGEGDTRPMVLRLAQLRAERAALLGKPNHAAFQLENQMAGTPEAVLKMLSDLAPTVVENTKKEAADIQALIDAQGGGFQLQPWDWEFYAEQVRAQKYDLDPELVKPYFELDRVLRDGVFYTLNRFYGVSFNERRDLPVYHPDVRVFDVIDSDGTQIGLFYADYFARPSKRGGAWMSTFVDQSELLNQKPVALNVMNIPKPVEGQPALMTFDEVTTMFHEVGHGVHGLFSKVKYPSLAGTAVPRDFVEFPSQFEEDWAKHPEILANYAKHHQTGEPIPAELMQKVLNASGFNQGFDTLEYVAASFLDMEWHTLPQGAVVEDVEAFEKAALAKHGVDFAPVPPRYRSAFFAHVFPGGYSSGYYAYIWSEVLAADAFAFVTEQGGLNAELGAAYRQGILSRGGTEDPMEMYVKWRGKQPDADNLLYRRGLKNKSDD